MTNARDLYVIQGSARGVTVNYDTTLWSTNAIFYNTAGTPREVHLEAISNGGIGIGVDTRTITIPALQSRRLEETVIWRPVQDASLWVLHLDVPPEVRVESVLTIGSENIAGPPIARSRLYGIARLPVFESLVPANELQVHLETDIGDIPAHTNVAIYNGGASAGRAQIDVYRHCDDTLVETRTVVIPGDTMLQVGGFASAAPNCTDGGTQRSVYTIVTVDQPSLTFVSSLANSGIPTTSIAIN